MTVNLCGLIPWVAGVSAHTMFRFCVAVPVWVARLFATAGSAPIKKVADLVASGVAFPVAVGLGLIELISLFMRPLTLAVRLAANIMAGHILIALVARAMFSSLVSVLLCVVVGTFLMLFESAVGFVQGYVFVLLVRNYFKEWPVK